MMIFSFPIYIYMNSYTFKLFKFIYIHVYYIHILYKMYKWAISLKKIPQNYAQKNEKIFKMWKRLGEKENRILQFNLNPIEFLSCKTRKNGVGNRKHLKNFPEFSKDTNPRGWKKQNKAWKREMQLNHINTDDKNAQLQRQR